MSQLSNLTSTSHYQQQDRFIERALRCSESIVVLNKSNAYNSSDSVATICKRLGFEK